MHRFYCPIQNISGNKIILSDKEQIHHLKDVLRLKAGKEIMLFDEQGNEYNSIIERLSSNTICLKIKQKYKPAFVGRVKITVASAIPKKSKFDDIVDKLTQLGVERIIPLKTERSLIKLDQCKETQKLQRWKKIALSATQQSQRNAIPIIDSVKDIKEILAVAENFDLKLIPTLAGRPKPLREALADFQGKNILVLIGPEGDFSPSEVELAKKAGCVVVSLGDLVLRVETAAVAVVSFIRLNFTS